ncbi:MAG: hypothetical protein AAGI71_08300 [Bacteroidota bacterium]
MEQRKWYKNPEMLIALSALFIGLITAFISIYSAATDRAYARASVWPRLELSRSVMPETFSYNVVNNGTGPALIKHTLVKLDDEYLQAWWDIEVFSGITQSYIGGGTIPAGNAVNPLVYRGASTADVVELDRRIDIQICYCSIYDECWIVDRSNTHESVGSCGSTPDYAFER